MRIPIYSASACLTFLAVCLAGTSTRADVVYLCSDGSNIVIEHATPQIIAKLRRTNSCVRNHHRKLDRSNRRIAEIRRYYASLDSRTTSATWDLCGEPSCHSVGKRRYRRYYDRSGPMVAIDRY